MALPTPTPQQQPEPVYENIPESPVNEYTPPSANLPEAGGIAYCHLYTQHGIEISLTERRSTAVEAVDALIYTVKYAMERYGLKGEVQIRPAPVSATPSVTTPSTVPSAAPSAPQAPANMPARVCLVTKVKHIKSKSQKHMVVCTTAEFPEGVMAFDKQMPQGVDFMAWTLFQEYAPPPQMQYAVVDPIKKWVTGFQSTP